MIDKTDNQIIFELLQDCRQAVSKIAKTIGLSQQRISYRIKKLEEKRIIKKYTIAIDYSKLGYNRHSLYLDLRTVSVKEMEAYIKEITDINDIDCYYLLHDDSQWQMYISIWAKTLERYDEIQTKILSKFSKHIKNYNSFQSVKSWAYFARVLNPKKKASCDIKGDSANIELKEMDWKILSELRANSKILLVDIANKLNVDINTIKRRMSFLTKEKIIARFYPILDIRKLGLKEYLFISRVNPSGNKEIEKFIEYTQLDSRFGFVIKGVGYANLYYTFYVKDSQELREVTTKIEEILGDSIMNTYKIEVAEVIG